MKRVYAYLMVAGFMLSSLQLFAQKRYIDEVYTDADIEVTSNVTYATNIDFLRSSRLSSASQLQVGTELTAIKTALFLQCICRSVQMEGATQLVWKEGSTAGRGRNVK